MCLNVRFALTNWGGGHSILFLFSMEITWCGVNVDVRPVSRFMYMCGSPLGNFCGYDRSVRGGKFNPITVVRMSLFGLHFVVWMCRGFCICLVGLYFGVVYQGNSCGSPLGNCFGYEMSVRGVIFQLIFLD